MKRFTLFAIAAMICLASFTAKAQEGTVTHNGQSYTQASYSRKADYRADDLTEFQLVLGYVNKSWVCKYPSVTQRENYFGEAGKFLHGFQVGFLYTPTFEYGLGLRVGINFDFYFDSPSWMKDYCDGFEEFDMYIPVHFNYRVYFNDDDFGLNLFTGPSFQWAMYGDYYKYRGSSTGWGYKGWGWWGPRRYDYYDTQKAQYGNGWPEQVNWQIDLGLSFKLKMIELGFQYSFGLNDHKIQNTFDDGKTYETANPARQDKMQAWISFVF